VFESLRPCSPNTSVGPCGLPESRAGLGSLGLLKRDIPVNAFIQEMLQVGIYKRTQGRITRQVTWAALFATVLLGCWRMYDTMIDYPPAIRGGIPLLIVLALGWISYRLVNIPKVADFLSAVEAEMAKVSWPTWGELMRASVVVLVTIFAMAFALFGFDAFWSTIFRALGIL
jgi:preprotein translocase subunit SecE